jgi:hypothetical protein
MAPAFFYHKGEYFVEADLDHLIAPLQNILPTLSKMLLVIVVRILEYWTQISEYVEQFIAGQDTFLHEDRHDRLLFDDDNFTRSRQYFWVITSIGKFIPIINETINHYKNVVKWVSRSRDELRGHREHREKLEAVKERFETQRRRATELRDGVSPIN